MGEMLPGGMLAKVRDMVNLVHERPHLSIRIIDGRVAHRLHDVLTQNLQTGTLISMD